MVLFQLPPSAPCPRLCVMIKKSLNQEYGFNLHAEKVRGQFIGAIDNDSPADISGLRSGDRIFAVNGALVQGESHKQVIQRIKENPLQCELLVISEEGAEWYFKNKIQITPSLPNVIRVCRESQKSPKICEETIKEDNSRINSGYNTNLIQQPMLTLQTAPRPRLCYLRKNDPSEEFGFNVHLENGKGHYIGVVDYNGIAYNAGLETGQRIVGINNQIIYPNTPHKEVVTLIKRTPLEARLLVASEDVDKWYIDNNIEYNFDNCIYFKQNLSPSTIINSNKIQNSRSRLDPQINNLSPIPRSNNARSMSCGSNRTNKSTSSSENDWKESQNKLTGNDIGNKTFLNKDNKKNYKYCEEITVKKSFVDNVVHSNNPFEENDDESNNMNVILEKEPEITECRIITPKPRSRSPVPIANCKPFGGNVDVNSIHINNSVNNNDIIKYSDYSNNKKSNMDIFSLSAKEAREMMALNRKKDPRKQNTMSIEQKYKLISSL